VEATGEPGQSDDATALTAILKLLGMHTGRDLAAYRESTLLRQVRLRSRLIGQSGLSSYLDYLNDNLQEIEALADALSIPTTRFFRDPDAWAALQAQMIGPLVEAATPETPIRAWVIGCSTGEEAYTLGMLIDEEFESRRAQRNYLVFASDINENSITFAQAGRYPLEFTALLSSARLKRYFQPLDGQYRVCNEIRSHMVFAVHDVLQEVAIPRLNLVSCRNLLLYLKRDQQDGLIAKIRRACLDQGYLFIGSHDTVAEDLFHAIDEKHRIFAPKPKVKAPHGVPPVARSNPRGWGLGPRRPLGPRTPAGESTRTLETLSIAEEELQSAEEELLIVSDQLAMKLEELARANSNLESLIATTDSGMLFLDRNLNAIRMTLRFAELVGLRMEDLGSSVSRCAQLLEYERLKDDAQQVVMEGTPIEHRIERRDGRVFNVRIRPYRGAEHNEGDGAVVGVFEVNARQHLEPALRESEHRVAAELRVMQVLHRMTLAAAAALEVREALDHILAAAIELQRADMGNVQLLDNASGTLRIVAQRGFGPSFLARFESVSADDSTSCGRALRMCETVQVSDISSDSEYVALRDPAAEAGYCAVQSTPLISRGGVLLGVLSVHFRARRTFSERDTQLAELLARQAADLIEHRSKRQATGAMNQIIIVS
jgi:chemotaxis methyl-accepting protein methylase